jgi:hypothetical protein
MIIYANLGKSKPKLAPKKEREEYAEWLKKHGVDSTQNKKSKVFAKANTYSLKIPPGRATTKHIPSIDSGTSMAPAAPRKVYTGTKIIGIGTLHKSNAIPIFSDEEAKDIAKMRR